jgi:hypothetical protein
MALRESTAHRSSPTGRPLPGALVRWRWLLYLVLLLIAVALIGSTHGWSDSGPAAPQAAPSQQR